MRLESANSLDPDTLATRYSDASLTPSSAPGYERTLVLASIEHAGRLQSPVTNHARLSTPIPQELRVDQPCSSGPRLHSVVARGTNGQPRTYRLASRLAQRAADRTLALAILGLDVGHLAAEPTRRPPQPRARCQHGWRAERRSCSDDSLVDLVHAVQHRAGTGPVSGRALRAAA